MPWRKRADLASGDVDFSHVEKLDFGNLRPVQLVENLVALGP